MSPRQFVTRRIAILAGVVLFALNPNARAAATPPADVPLAPGEPSIDQMLSLRRAASPAVSPDGRYVAYTVRDTDMVGNAYVTQLWLADAETTKSRPLTFGAKSNSAPAWSPDGAHLAFLSERTDKRQVWSLDMRGGEPEKLTSADEGVTAFAWSPDGASIAYTAPEGRDDARKERDKRLGELERDSDHGAANLWLHTLGGARGKRLTSGGWAVGDFSWSPDGTRIAFDHQVWDALAVDSTKDISVLDVTSGHVTLLVSWRGPDGHPVWSPDGTRIAFETAAEDPAWYYSNGMIATVQAAGGTPTVLTRDFDEDVSLVAWTPAGLWFSANRTTAAYLYKLDPTTRATTRLLPEAGWAGTSWNLTRDGGWATFVASDATHYPEVFLARAGEPGVALTTLGEQLAGWHLGTSQVVEWKSRDGAHIEGILRKPFDWKAGTRRPLLVVIHGGPTGVSRPSRFAATYVYPIEHWLAKGALVLEPNYRGSAGYGAAFRALNVRNLGVGDAWDVVSGIDSLVARRARGYDPHRRHGLEPGRLHLGVSRHPRVAPLQGHLRRRRHLRLDDVLRQHRHHAVHAAVLEGHAVGRPGHLCDHVAHHHGACGGGHVRCSSSTAAPTRACRRRTRASCTARWWTWAWRRGSRCSRASATP